MALRACGDEPHLSDRAGPEADADRASVVDLADDANAAFEDEMHGERAGIMVMIVRLADFEPLAESHNCSAYSALPSARAAESRSVPAVPPHSAMRAAMTSFSQVSSARSRSSAKITSSEMNLRLRKAFVELGGHVHQHEAGAKLIGGALDLGEAVHRRTV